MLSNPLWVKIEEGEHKDLQITRVVVWPKLHDTTNELAAPFLPKLRLQQDLLFTTTKFKLGLQDPTGTFWVFNRNAKLLCLWIPNSFSTLNGFAERIFNNIEIHEMDLSEFISKFHSTRKSAVQLFSDENAKRIELPPLWLFPKSVIRGQFLPLLSSHYTQLIGAAGKQYYDLITRNFSEDQKQIIENIPFEKELLAFHIFQEYLLTIHEIDRRLLSLAEHKDMLRLIDPEFYDLVFLYHCSFLDNYPEHVYQELQRIESTDGLPILNTIASLYLADAALAANNLEIAMQEYYRVLHNVENSSPYIMARANIGISQINYNIGNYLYADIAYSLAIEKIKLLNDVNMLSKAELELVKIRIMQAKNLFHHSFYEFNNNFQELKYENALYPLFQGIILMIDLLGTNIAYTDIIKEALVPSLSTIVNILSLHQKYIEPHINFDLQDIFTFVTDLSQGTLDREFTTKLRKKMIRIGIPKVEKLVIFTNDGRQIGEVIRKDNAFMQLGLMKVDNPLFAPALSSIASFIKEAVTKNPTDEIESIDLGRFIISFYRGNFVVLAIYSNVLTKQLKEDMQRVINDYERANYSTLKNWKGLIDELAPLLDFLKGYSFYAIE